MSQIENARKKVEDIDKKIAELEANDPMNDAVYMFLVHLDDYEKLLLKQKEILDQAKHSHDASHKAKLEKELKDIAIAVQVKKSIMDDFKKNDSLMNMMNIESDPKVALEYKKNIDEKSIENIIENVRLVRKKKELVAELDALLKQQTSLLFKEREKNFDDENLHQDKQNKSFEDMYEQNKKGFITTTKKTNSTKNQEAENNKKEAQDQVESTCCYIF